MVQPLALLLTSLVQDLFLLSSLLFYFSHFLCSPTSFFGQLPILLFKFRSPIRTLSSTAANAGNVSLGSRSDLILKGRAGVRSHR